TASVQYILYYRTDKRAVHLARLKAAEEAVLKQTPTAGHEGAAENTFRAVGLSLRIEALRQAARAAWLSDVDRAVDSFLVLAENQAKFLTVKQKAEPVLVTGLPSFEPVVKPAAAPDQLEKDSVGSAQSVVTFVRAVQRQWHGHLIKAGNYGGHELGNPHYGNVEFLGKFSFDVDLGSFAKVREDGFYEHDPVVDFFLAVERASAETNIGWLALYNDFAVAKEVNEQIGEFRIGFSGGGSPIKAPPEKEGSLHHGPAPYILHIHFNIMVRQPAAMLLRDKDARRINLGFTGDQ
ncbi:MAG TPA: hypothetical protein VJX66_19060, partial [Amycolatopsis sp.]|nr:hypothetical protein [Amycolatopsis sp.]